MNGADLAGRVVVLTENPRGLAPAVADVLAERGAIVERVRVEDAPRLVPEVARRRGRIDAAVLAHARLPAAPNVGVPVGALDAEVLGAALVRDVGGAVACLAALAPVMAARGRGRVVVVAGTLGLRGFAGMGAVTAVQHALVGLVQATAREWSATPLRICAACPGLVETEEMRTLVGGVFPLMPARTVAGMIAVLCSDAASAVSGTAVVMDGGASGF